MVQLYSLGRKSPHQRSHMLRIVTAVLVLGLTTSIFHVCMNAQVFVGTKSLRTQADVDTFHYTSVIGSIRIDDQNFPGSIRNLDGLAGLTSVSENLLFFFTDSLQNVDGLSNLTSIGGWLSLRFTGIRNLNGLSNLTSLGGMWLDANHRLTDISGLSNLTELDSLWITWNRNLTNLNGIHNIQSVGQLSIFRNNLPNLDAFSNLTMVRDTLWIAYEPLTNIDGLSNLTSIGKDLLIQENAMLRRYCGLNTVLSGGGLTGSYNVNNNQYNPTAQQIIDCGPCSGIEEPTAVVTGPATVVVGATVALSATGSTDPDSGALSYRWHLWWWPDSSTAKLSDSTAATPTFKPDRTGTYFFNVFVNDGCGESAVDELAIYVVPVQDAVEDVADLIQALPASAGNKNALNSKLQAALKRYQEGNLLSAKNQLVALLNQLSVYVKTGVLTQAAAQPIIDYVNQILAAINAMLPRASAENHVETPMEYALSQNYPNPFNPLTMIDYSLREAGMVSLTIYDILGRRVATLVNEVQGSGVQSVEFDAGSFPSGMYFYKLSVVPLSEGEPFVRTMKMVLTK